MHLAAYGDGGTHTTCSHGASRGRAGAPGAPRRLPPPPTRASARPARWLPSLPRCCLRLLQGAWRWSRKGVGGCCPSASGGKAERRQRPGCWRMAAAHLEPPVQLWVPPEFAARQLERGAAVAGDQGGRAPQASPRNPQRLPALRCSSCECVGVKCAGRRPSPTAAAAQRSVRRQLPTADVAHNVMCHCAAPCSPHVVSTYALAIGFCAGQRPRAIGGWWRAWVIGLPAALAGPAPPTHASQGGRAGTHAGPGDVKLAPTAGRRVAAARSPGCHHRHCCLLTFRRVRMLKHLCVLMGSCKR